MSKEKETLLITAGSRRSQTAWLYFVVASLIACMTLPAFAASGQYIVHNTPKYVSTAKNLGTEDPSKTIEVSIWLQPHNRSQMDALATQLYDRTSSNYRQFLNHSQIAARFYPTAEEATTVQHFFESHNLKVVRVGPDNFYVRARGTIADVEAAFQVQLNHYQVRDKVLRANSTDPYVDGSAAPLVRAISGLDSGQFEHPYLARPTLPQGASAAVNPAAATSSNFFSSDCFDAVVKQTYSTNNDGELPIGTYRGNHLNLQSLTSAGCAYTPGRYRPPTI